MSEYQYYEFRTIDHPLTPEQMSELRDLSKRAVITRSSFTNTYSYGDFRGSPHELMNTYFDAHVYVSNFGTVQFMLRLPRTAIPESILNEYATPESLEWWVAEENTVLEWSLNDEPSGEWMDGEEWMDQLLAIREELIRGDYRSLYIGWLSSIAVEMEYYEEEEEEEDVDRREPPVPAGLQSLTPSQTALAEFLDVPSDLIAVAAEALPDAPENETSGQSVEEWVAQLPEQEVRAFLVRLCHGEGLRIQTELLSRYHRARSEDSANSLSGTEASERRTAGTLLTLAMRAERERTQREREEKERKRHAYLAELATRFSELWGDLCTQVESSKNPSYDTICNLLVDMRDAYIQDGRPTEFDEVFARFLGQYSRRTALTRTLKKVGLIT